MSEEKKVKLRKVNFDVYVKTENDELTIEEVVNTIDLVKERLLIKSDGKKVIPIFNGVVINKEGTEMIKNQHGIFGSLDSFQTKDDFYQVGVIIQESGLYAGIPPNEMRVRKVIEIYGNGEKENLEFLKSYTAKLNRTTDLPFYCGKALLKVLKTEKYTDEDLIKENIKILD